MSEAIEFDAVVYKVQTLASDLGVRVTLDLPETCIPQMAMLAETKRNGLVLHFKATVPETLTELDDETGKRAKRNITHVGRGRV